MAAHSQCQSDPASEDTLGYRNKEHFDQVASTVYEVPWVRKIAEQITEELRESISWIKIPNRGDTGDQSRPIRLLDYACGNGVASRALASAFTEIRGVDLSHAMVDQYNLLARKSGLAHDAMHAVQGDFVDPKTNSSPIIGKAEYYNFDVAIISMALHHVDDIVQILRAMAERLRNGGALLIVDWAILQPEDSIVPKTTLSHLVSRVGFSREDLEAAIADANLSHMDWKLASSDSEMPEEHGGGKRRLFFARAEKN